MRQIEEKLLGDAVPLQEIESRFRRFWRETAGSDSEAVLKAATLNLVVLCRSRKEFASVSEMLPQLVFHHPGRHIVVLADGERKQDEIRCRLGAFLQKTTDGRRQIVAETVMMENAGGFQHTAGAVLPLLLADLPVYLWLNFPFVSLEPNLTPLIHAADRLILTTSDTLESPAQLAAQLQAVIDISRRCSVSDLNWAQITPWREALARFFDRPADGVYLKNINAVEILDAGHALSVQALLLAGWLATSLPAPAPSEADSDSTVVFRRAGAQASVTLRRTAIDGLTGPVKVKLLAETQGKTAIFTAAAIDERLQATLQIGGSLRTLHTVPIGRLCSTLLCNELDSTGSDEAYLRSCNSVLEFLRHQIVRP